MNRETIEKRIAESEETMEICKLCGNERGYKMAQDRVNSLRKQLSEKSEAIDTRPERTGKEKRLSKKKMTLETICNGEVQEAIDRALIKAAENIADPNMDRKAPRTVTIQITMKPHEKDPEDVAVSVKVTKKLAAEQPFETGFFVTKDLRSGAVMIQEHGRGQIKGQLSLDDYEEVDEETGEIISADFAITERKAK